MQCAVVPRARRHHVPRVQRIGRGVSEVVRPVYGNLREAFATGGIGRNKLERVAEKGKDQMNATTLVRTVVWKVISRWTHS